jgi:small subunit ribosomal protein S6
VRRDYELGFILNPEVSEEQTRAILERIEQIVSRRDGQVVKVNQWGRRRLAYPIQHHRDGYYVFIDMILAPETVLELDRTLKVSEEVLRQLITRRDPKVAQKEREDRAEREAREAAAAAAAQAKAAARGAAGTEGEAEVAVPTPVGAESEAEVAVPAAGGEQDEVVVHPGEEETPALETPALTDEDLTDVPPAIEEEETIEAS